MTRPPRPDLFERIVGATRRLLNFCMLASAAGDHGRGGNSKQPVDLSSALATEGIPVSNSGMVRGGDHCTKRRVQAVLL